MPNTARQVALHTWLVTAALLLLLVGVTNGALAWWLPEALQPPLATLPLTLLVGGGLLAWLVALPRLARLCGGLLGVLATLALAAAQWPEVWPLVHWPLPVSPAVGAVVLGVALCWLSGPGAPWKRGLWMATGGAAVLLSGLSLPAGTAADLPWGGAFTTAFTAVPALLLGSALLLAGWQGVAPVALPRRVWWALLGSLAASVLAWFMLAWQQHDARALLAEELLASVKVSAESEIAEQQALLQRMAERWNELGGLPSARFRERELESYLRDVPSLLELYWQGPGERLSWGGVRDAGEKASGRMDDWLARDEDWLLDWLAVGGAYPRWILPDAERPYLALVAVPLSQAPRRQLVAVVDLAHLLRTEVRSAVAPLVLTARRAAYAELVLNGSVNGPRGLALKHSRVLLPGGNSLRLSAYLPAAQVASVMGAVPLGVGLGGLLLSYLMAFGLGMAWLSERRAVALAGAQRHLRAQQRVQTMVAQDRPLHATLKAVCRLVEARSSGAMTSIMLCDRHQRTLDSIVSVSLPEAYQAAVRGVRIAPHTGACGTAAYLREIVVCADIASDARWAGYHELARRHALRACWSAPILDSRGELLGTFASYYTRPGAPTAADRRQIVEAVKLVSLAVERQRSRETLQVLQRSVEASIGGVTIADLREPDMPLVYVNQAFERMTGYQRDEVLGRNMRFLQGPETDTAALTEVRRALAEHREMEVTLCNYRKDGTPFWNHLSLSPVRDDAGRVTHYVGVQHDISQRKADEAKLAYHASHDALTGLANRSLLEDRLAHDVMLAQRQNTGLAVLFIDLDDFKPINDSLGLEVGDQVLVQVARRIAETIRPGDTLARFGGDEFVLLLPGLDRDDEALTVAQRLLSCIKRPFQVTGHELYLSASIGVAFLGEGVGAPAELIQRADMAMYRAKQKGRNTWQCFTGEINAEVSERMALRNDLQEAIEAGNFELHYQPLLYASDEQVAGFEALVRWKHPERGYLSPGLFIPLAEETGQIIPISEWVLRQACSDMRALASEGRGAFRVSVNLSPLQFHRANFLDTLQRTLESTGLEPRYLELELTEGILLDDTAGAIATLTQLREMGIQVTIDDFGTGFSSLSYLKVLPIGKIKIDRSFVRDVTRNPDDGAIVQGIISMAHHLGLCVVAEGIEEAEQGAYLAERGCDIFQGFHYARPMPLARLRDYLAERQLPACGVQETAPTADS